MGVRQAGTSLEGDFFIGGLIDIDLNQTEPQKQLLDLDPGDLLDLALLDESGHLGGIGDRLLDLLEGVLVLLLLKHPHEAALAVVPDLLHVAHWK